MDGYQLIALTIFLMSTGYLLWRASTQVRRQRYSYRQIPFGPSDLWLTAEKSSDKRERPRATLVGVAVGDALGAPRESLPVWLTRWRYGASPRLSRGVFRFMRRRGTITDDTQLTLLTARCLGSDGRFDNEAFLCGLRQWVDYRIGEGKATLQAAMAGGDESKLDRKSQGNGAAMRIAPIALAANNDIERMLDLVYQNGALTHPNPEAIAGAECIARLLAACLRSEEGHFEIREAIESILPRRFSEDLPHWRNRLESALRAADSAEPGLAEIGTSGWVFNTVAATIYLLARHKTDFAAGLTELFQVGGDVDTIAAIYGSVVGALAGMGPFRPWVSQVQGTPALLEEADRLHGITCSVS